MFKPFRHATPLTLFLASDLIFFAEAIDSPFGINKLRLAGKEWMAG